VVVVEEVNNLHTEGVGKTTEFVSTVCNYKLAGQRVRERPSRQLKGDLEGIVRCLKKQTALRRRTSICSLLLSLGRCYYCKRKRNITHISSCCAICINSDAADKHSKLVRA
jgi:hypothetical protein